MICLLPSHDPEVKTSRYWYKVVVDGTMGSLYMGNWVISPL